MMSDINTHNLVCDFGRHKGTLYTRMPLSYLKWMVNCNHSKADIAKAELERRGTLTPDLEITGHALDRVSLYCLDIWERSKDPEEGIYSWLLRMTAEARVANRLDKQGRFIHNGMRFAIEDDGVWPVLKTVIRRSKGGKNMNKPKRPLNKKDGSGKGVNNGRNKNTKDCPDGGPGKGKGQGKGKGKGKRWTPK